MKHVELTSRGRSIYARAFGAGGTCPRRVTARVARSIARSTCTAALICVTIALTSPRVWPGRLALAAAASEARTSSAATDTAADRAMPAPGKVLFETDCAACHQESGEGISGVFPALKGNRAVNKPDPTHHIHAVLFGERGMRVGGVRYLGPMPPFGARLSDRDVAAIVNFERGAWGNRGRPVTVSEVASVRARGAQAEHRPGIGDAAGWASSGQNERNAPGAAAFLLTLTSIALDLSALPLAGHESPKHEGHAHRDLHPDHRVPRRSFQGPPSA